MTGHDHQFGRRILEIARASIQSVFRDEVANAPDLRDEHSDCRGVFVTLHSEDRLRGCIGRLESAEPLAVTVAAMARAAAFDDPRFPPLDEAELATVQIEVSVLSPMTRVTNPEQVIVGTHGILIVSGSHRGVLLPQVAVEHSWTSGEFLEQTCLKASLPSNSWRGEDTTVYVFSADVYQEDG